MSFKENLLKKIQIRQLSRKVLASFGPPEGPSKIDKDAMRSLLESLLNIDPAVPAEFTLRQNYPNPFNPQTTISFDLPQSQVVSLIVFNIMGQMVSVPISGQRLSAGVHFIDFDASDLSSGVYFYRINDKSK